MRIVNSNISMSSSREFSQGVRVTSRNRLLSVSASSFFIKDMDNNTQAVVRKTGIFLKESGKVGSIKQIDLVV